MTLTLKLLGVWPLWAAQAVERAVFSGGFVEGVAIWSSLEHSLDCFKNVRQIGFHEGVDGVDFRTGEEHEEHFSLFATSKVSTNTGDRLYRKETGTGRRWSDISSLGYSRLGLKLREAVTTDLKGCLRFLLGRTSVCRDWELYNWGHSLKKSFALTLQNESFARQASMIRVL